ncbi:hypothetical protein BDQ17DRAFT_1339579 [Cyathus striatus]|nr:hypothetical protein BDQ17DRAFT_1339579 [Cyathus striatus]
MAKSSSTPPATLHPMNIRQSSRLQSISSQPSTSLSKCSKDLDVNSERGNDMLSTATAPKAALEVAMGKFLPNPGIDSEGGSKELLTATIPNVASEAALGKFLPNLDVDSEGDLDADSEGGNKELPTTTASDTDIGNDIVIDNLDVDGEGGNKKLPTTTAPDADIDLDVHSTIPTTTAPTAPITTDPITGSIFQEGDIPKVHQTPASNYNPDALAKLKATSHKYFSKEGLYIHMCDSLDAQQHKIEPKYVKCKCGKCGKCGRLSQIELNVKLENVANTV